MAFYGHNFSFDGISCAEFGLMLYDFNSKKDEVSKIATTGQVIEDRISRRPAALFYGIRRNTPLEFTLTFGVNPDADRQMRHMDRWDIEAISSWLTGKNGYCWLEIEQADLDWVRYKCVVTDLSVQNVGWAPYACTAKFVCDSPFAYTYPEVFSFSVNGILSKTIINSSSYHGYYCPRMTITSDSPDFAIINHSDNGSTFRLRDIPAAAGEIKVDNELGLLSCAGGLNLYPNCVGFRFLRLRRGLNQLEFHGQARITITCEFPVNIGG